MNADHLRSLAMRAIEKSEKATKGPWLRDPYDGPRMQVIAHGNEVVAFHAHHPRQRDERVVPNYEFIASSRTTLPVLARAVLAILTVRDDYWASLHEQEPVSAKNLLLAFDRALAGIEGEESK